MTTNINTSPDDQSQVATKKIGFLFDMDGVIIHNHQYHVAAWIQFCAKYGKPMDEDEYRVNINGRTAATIIRYIFGEATSPEDVKKYSNEKEALYRELYKPYLKATNGLIDFLAMAKAHDIPMAVATSAPTENATFTLDGLGIRHYFKAVLDENYVTKGKPDPEIYIKAADVLQLPPAQCVVFEDALAGIEAGNAAGCKVVGVATSHKRSELLNTHMLIDDFSDIRITALEHLVFG